jgi:hypothetical protein
MQNGEQAFHHHTTSAPSGSIICNSSIALITPAILTLTLSPSNSKCGESRS